MGFEYDSTKSAINKQKHGVDFEEAKTIWSTTHVKLPAITEDEQRYMIIGKINTSLFSRIFTIREKKIRIISCRRSRKKDRNIYHEKIKE
ncbi:MAG: BrnT family toxin [Candidatus Scalindua sp.]|nr:BrnT family toxin [Candidatus Scalindua sp.]MCR4345117.1 BrnT family toxin [Candidatus Scalindua sp.]